MAGVVAYFEESENKMTGKIMKLTSAWLSLMLEAVGDGHITLKKVLFSRKEIIERTNSLYGLNLNMFDNTFANIVYKEGKDRKKTWLVNKIIPSTEHYYSLSYFEYPSQKYIDKMIGGLLEKSNWQYKNKYSEQSLEDAFSIYYQFMQRQTFEKQREESNVIAKEAIWIAGVTLTYNEFVRSNSTNLQDYFFTQVTIGRLAHSFNKKNTLSTCVNMIGRFFTKGLTEQTEAYFVQNPLGDPNKRRGEASLRRICLMDEDDNAFPEISYEFVVQTLDGPKTVSELKKFMQNDFSKVINQNSIPLNENHSYEEMYEHAKTLSMNSLERIAISRESMDPEELPVAVRRFHRDPYIVQYARRRANGICQLCKQPVPFIKTDGEPYLEVHHIKMLADGGADALYNVVALCPNCHRRMHYLKDVSDIKELQRIAELNG